MEENKDDRASTPQLHAEKCPVCNGFGTLKYGTIICQACKGQGYILVPNFQIEGQTEGEVNERI